MKNVWKIAGCYRLADSERYDETGIWYINDEFGTSIGHADDGNVKLVPFLYAPNNKMDDKTISYSLVWPIKDLSPGEDLNRDFLMGITEEH